MRTEKMDEQERTQRNLNPHREARLAMIVWGLDYSNQRGGSMDFYDALSDSKKRYLREWCDELERTPRAALAASPDTTEDGDGR